MPLTENEKLEMAIQYAHTQLSNFTDAGDKDRALFFAEQIPRLVAQRDLNDPDEGEY